MRWLAVLVLAGCGRLQFDHEVLQGSAITLTADNGYLLAVGSGGVMTTVVASVINTDEHDIADCPLGFGPERWDLTQLPPFDELYIWVYDRGEARGLIGQLETPDGPRPLTATGLDACAGDSPSDDLATDAAAMLAQCDRGEATASGGWLPGGGRGELATGVWYHGYPVCPGVLAPEAAWMWWSDGVIDPLVSVAGPNAFLVRLAVRAP